MILSTIADSARYPYPRRRFVRAIMRFLARLVLHTLTRFEVIGRENIPQNGPLLIVPNHFHLSDVALVVAVFDDPIDFLGGFHMPNAPDWVLFLPKLYGFYPVHRGTTSMEAMRAAQAIMAQQGKLVIFPEGGSWADVLCYPRPGTAFIAAKTGARLLPVGLDGQTEIFKAWRQFRRPQVTVRIGRPFGPYAQAEKGHAKREQLDAIGEEIMLQIKGLLPPERHGIYSDDAAVRAQFAEIAKFPYGNLHQEREAARTSRSRP